MPSAGERLLAAEMIGCVTVSWISQVWGNKDALKSSSAQQLMSGAAPKPQVFLPIIGAYSALGLVAMFGDQAARLAGGLGGLVALVVILKAAGTLFSNRTSSLFSAPTQGVVTA